VHESSWAEQTPGPWDEQQHQLGQWLAALPKPVAVMACNDALGHRILDACGRFELAVPEAVAVLGADDDELLCLQGDPPLSSVILNAEQVGFEAASMLEQLMLRKPPIERHRVVAPLGVRARQSTDSLSIDDPDLVVAVRLIRRHACDGISIDDVLGQVALSRSQLERRYRKFLGITPQDDIRQIQLRRIQQLLAESDLPLERIAELSGFQSASYMSVFFKRELGQTPGQFRRQLQR
jgi:LacI family transcriptional regulator